jgi:hypothetical protein
MLPDFLGIGVPKAGSTWLYELLRTHPDIWVPPKRREVRFLSQVPDRSLSWYESFFPSDDNDAYAAVGEVTPYYLYCEEERIEYLRREIPTAKKFIVMLRHPVDRIYSLYWFKRRVANLDKPFVDFVEQNEDVLEDSLYVSHVERWMRYFDRDQFLFLLFEEDLPDAARARGKIADFLGVAANDFPKGAGEGKENERYLPVFRGLYSWATNFAERLRKNDLDWLIHFAKQIGIKRVFGRKTVGDKAIDEDVRAHLNGRLLGQTERLEELTGKDLSVWLDD